MKKHPMAGEMKAIRLLQDRSAGIDAAHSGIAADVRALKDQLAALGMDPGDMEDAGDAERSPDSGSVGEFRHVELAEILVEADSRYPASVELRDIVTPADLEIVERRLDRRIAEFDARYGLDRWDYAIACSCGLFASMLDLLCVRAPPKPTAAWSGKVDGVFNQWVQKAFNSLLPPETSKRLGLANGIGGPDASSADSLVGGPAKALSPRNHRLRSLSHDPILGFVFGVWDMTHGTCTAVVDGRLVSLATDRAPVDGSAFQLLGRMFGHLLSDINAPSAKGNRGMGLPAPFMGVLRMLEGLPLGDSSLGRQVEGMYLHGYDCRQFAATSIPMAIMEVLLRAFYAAKQTKLHGAAFGEALCETLPGRMNPRFRMVLALAYGTSSAVNAGKLYVTQDLLGLDYASWLGLAWNGFHALRWALLDRHLKLWGEIEEREIRDIETTVDELDALCARAARLPV